MGIRFQNQRCKKGELKFMLGLSQTIDMCDICELCRFEDECKQEDKFDV